MELRSREEKLRSSDPNPLRRRLDVVRDTTDSQRASHLPGYWTLYGPGQYYAEYFGARSLRIEPPTEPGDKSDPNAVTVHYSEDKRIC